MLKFFEQFLPSLLPPTKYEYNLLFQTRSSILPILSIKGDGIYICNLPVSGVLRSVISLLFLRYCQRPSTRRILRPGHAPA